MAITVSDSVLASISDRFTLNINLPVAPTATVSGLPGSVGPAQQYPITITLSGAYEAPITGQAILTFAPDSGPTDRTVQFASGGTIANFNIPVGSTTNDAPPGGPNRYGCWHRHGFSGNTGSGNPGTTDFQILAAGPGLVSFTYSYFSLDQPTFDYAGYVLGPNFSLLSDGTSNTSGTQSFSVAAGQSFGFRVGTTDNQFEPGILSISNFTAPAGPDATSSPEPGTALVICRPSFSPWGEGEGGT